MSGQASKVEVFGLGKFLNLIFFLIAQAHRVNLGSVWSRSTRTDSSACHRC